MRLPRHEMIVSRCSHILGAMMGVLLFVGVWSVPTNVRAEDGPNTATPSTAVAVIDGYHETLLTVMQNAVTMSYDERARALEDDIRGLFDSRFMARGATGLTWRDFSAEEKASLSAAIEDFTLANYAARFNGYSGQKFEFVDTQDVGRGMIFVKTQLVKANGEAISLNYLMRPVDGGWLIGDVFLDGKYSEIALRRAEFAPILQDGGIDALLVMLREKVIELSNENAS